MSFLLKRRSDSRANWELENPIVPDRQLIFVKDGGGSGIPLIKIGDGVSNWASLPYINKRNNFNAATNPTVTDDINSFYTVGSMWSNKATPATPLVYICTDSSVGAAVWVQINISSGSGAVDSVNGATGVVVLDLNDIDDVPAYPNDGSDYVLVENTGVLTWELYTTGSGGQVDSVVGTADEITVDATDPINPIVALATAVTDSLALADNAIPLSGTEVGSPVTGDIELTDAGGAVITIKQDNNQIIFDSDQNFLTLIGGTPGGNEGSVSIEGSDVGISSNDGTNFKIIVLDPINGLRGQAYYAPPSDNYYTQRKYVDDGTAKMVTSTADFTVANRLVVVDATGRKVKEVAVLYTDLFKEELIIGTATYSGTNTGTVNLDLSTFSDKYLILTGNTTLTVSNLPASGKTFVKDLTIKSAAAQTLTLPVGWKVIGTYAADGSENYLSIKFTSYPTIGAHVVCNIFQV